MSAKTRQDNAKEFNCDVCREEDNHKLCSHGTTITATHTPTTYSLIFFDDGNNIVFESHKSSDEGLIREYYKDLHRAQKELLPLLTINKDSMRLSEADQTDFRNAEKMLFMSEFNSFTDGDPKVRDHQHGITTKITNYLGAAHRSCNVNRRQEKKIVIAMHNLGGYDLNFLLEGYEEFSYINEEGAEAFINFRFDALPKNTERFRTLNVGCFSFHDSLALLPGSLSSLVNNLQNGSNDFKMLEQLYFITNAGG